MSCTSRLVLSVGEEKKGKVSEGRNRVLRIGRGKRR